ncbi:MAG: sulfur carrier protein ThiS [Terriglobia bacterium]
MNESISILLNGESREIPEGLTLLKLIEWLKLSADRLAIERNLNIVPRVQWEATHLEPGDRLEVVHLVGGG